MAEKSLFKAFQSFCVSKRLSEKFHCQIIALREHKDKWNDFLSVKLIIEGNVENFEEDFVKNVTKVLVTKVKKISSAKKEFN